MGAGSFKREIGSLPRNVKASIFVLPLWSIPNGLVSSYASLYMLDQGITAGQVGAISSMSFVVKTLLALFAGYIVNRMGRRRAAGILDIIGWAVPMLIFSFASKPWHFVVASLINCIVVVSAVTNACLLAEDVPKDRRLLAQSYMGMMGALCTLFVPISGLLINRLSLVPAMRWMYLFAAASMFAAALGKLVFVRETTVGREMMKRRRQQVNPFRVFPRQARLLLANRRLLALFGLNLVLQFALNVNNLFYFPYLTQYLRFTELQVSFFPFITTAISLAIYFLVIPRIQNMMNSLLRSVLLYCAGALALLGAALLGRQLAYACVLLWAVAAAIMSPVLNTTIANAIEDDMRSELLSFFNVLSMLCMFPAGAFGGWLYGLSPLFPVVFVFAMYLAALLALVLLRRPWRKTPQA